MACTFGIFLILFFTSLRSHCRGQMSQCLTCSRLTGSPVWAHRVPHNRTPRLHLRCHASDRRGALLGLGSTLLLYPQPSKADYGDSANVFGKVTNKSGYVPYQGDNFAVLLPARWNPSKEREFPGIVLRYEDNAAAANSVMVLREETDKGSMEEFGAPEQFLQRVAFLLGQQSFSGETESEGGFAPGRVSAASLLGVEAEKDKKGQKTYYNYELFTRTADGEEGGRHYLLRATVSNGQLFILRVTAGDKRWFKGAAKTCKEVTQSFTVA
ncbi:oxygen-evolving enhancer protein 2, chloroplastic [Haematococcus lacustris]